jgi:trehalose 6-phosphate synthase/trehalose 6-phosphate phosphatase
MTPEAAERLNEFFDGFARYADAILLLDFDGTLAPFRLDRFKARPWAGVRELLTAIQRGKVQGLQTRMAVVTGRPAGEISPMLGLEPALEVWGLHGAERLYPDGRRELEQGPPATMEKLAELREKLKRDNLGGLFEDKANGAVMHWRGASPQKAKHIEERTRALFEPLARLDGLRLLAFEAGLELRVGRDKGGAVEAILAEAANGGPVAYLGDDFTDEAAFRVVNALGPRGLSVLVRREWRATDAQIWLRPPDELRAFLKGWLDAGCRSQQ